MRPRPKRPRPAMSDKALEKRRAEMLATGIRILTLLEKQGHTIDWSVVGGRPADLDPPPEREDRDVQRSRALDAP